MNRSVAFFVAMSAFVACNQASNRGNGVKQLSADTLVADIYSNKKQNKVFPDSIINKHPDSSGNQEIDLKEVLRLYIEKYSKPCIIDTAFKVGREIFRLRLKHYCTIDSMIKVPKNYVYMYHLDSLVTHNFVTNVELKKDNQLIFQGKIKKGNFQQLLYPQLRKYGVLFCPSIEVLNRTFRLNYSISIPLNDVGIAVNASIDSVGNIYYSN